MSKSIEQFLLDKRKVGCILCALGPKLKKQINRARENSRVRVADILEWLKRERGISVTPNEWRRHYRGMHEGPEAQVHKKITQ